jgi:hypothetical protein
LQVLVDLGDVAGRGLKEGPLECGRVRRPAGGALGRPQVGLGGWKVVGLARGAAG